MRQEIRWTLAKDKSAPCSLGRNGPVNTFGIEAWEAGDEVIISPLRKNGAAARCAIALPADMTILNQAIAMLGRVRDEITARPAQAPS
jgi:hypothetical protein